MNLTRRDFLRWASLSAVGAVACGVFPEREFDIQSPARLPEDLVSGDDNWYATLCGQCPEQEGILVRVFQGRAKKVQGNPVYPSNTGKQGPRCEAGLQHLYHPDRIPTPLVRVGLRGEGRWATTSWTDALNRVKQQLLVRRSANDADNMLMVTEPLRGQLGAVASRFTNEYGGRHMTFEAMDNTALRTAVKDVFDQDMLPAFDIANARYLLSFGADFLSTWLAPTHFGRAYGHFRSGHDRGYFVHADSRYSMTAANADEWLPISPGTEGILALSIAYEIMRNAEAWGVDTGVVEQMTAGTGYEALASFAPDAVAGTGGALLEGLPNPLRGEAAPDAIRRIAHEFATSEGSLAIGGGAAGAHTNGAFNLKAILALNYLVGTVNRTGGVVFNPPPPIEGYMEAPAPATIAQWQQATGNLRSGNTKVLLVRGANLVHGLPAQLGFGDAINRDDLYIVSFSSFRDETTEMADIVLPDRSSMEDWGDDISEPGTGYQAIGMRQPVVNPLPGVDPRGFGDLLLTLAQEVGVDRNLPNANFQAMLRAGSDRLFDMNRGSITQADASTPDEFWRAMLRNGGWWDPGATSQSVAPQAPDLAALVRDQGNAVAPVTEGTVGVDHVYNLVPFASNALLEGRDSHLPWLQALPDPLTTVAWQTWIEINLRDALQEDLRLGDLVEVSVVGAESGTVVALAYPHPAIPPGTVAMPLGQGHTAPLQYSQGKGANVLSVLPLRHEVETQALAWASNRVRIRKLGDRMRIIKFEGNDGTYQSAYHRIVEVTDA